MNIITIKDNTGATVGTGHAHTLADAKRWGDEQYVPGRYISIKTARGTTWVRRRDGWMHDTGKMQRRS